MGVKSNLTELRSLFKFLLIYFRIKVIKAAYLLEELKNYLVDLLMLKRGILQKRIWHTSMIGLSAFGVITSGAFGNATIVSSSFPGASVSDPRFAQVLEPTDSEPHLNSLYDTHTTVSQKDRDKIEDYEVKSGDTISTIAEKFKVSTDTIKWANDLENVNSIKPGEKIKILPVSGVSYIVKSGDSLESVAKKYSVDAQGILNFPFNDIPDDFKLTAGQTLIIPDGVPPQAPVIPRPRQQPQYLAQGPASPTFTAPGGASFIWPTSGSITQPFMWWHPGVDVANREGPAIAAADGGEVVVAGWPDGFGYGNRVVIDHGNGYQTLYAHLSNIYVTVGQTISRGQVIGRMGSTGRSTGTHLHFEVHFKGIAINPLAILK